MLVRRFETNRYSVPFAYAKSALTLKADDNFVYIYDKDRLITKHKRFCGRHTLIEDLNHYKGLLESRPNAIYFRQRNALIALGEVARLIYLC